MSTYTRNTLAKRLGVGIEALRYYENRGLIPSPQRASNGYRIYSEKDADRIGHVLTAKKYGFSLAEIKQLLEIGERTRSHKNLRPFFYKKLADIDHQIKELINLKKMLLRTLQSNSGRQKRARGTR